LKGLNFYKNKQDPIAMEDHEYPDWLWRALDKKSDDATAGAAGGEGDLFGRFDARQSAKRVSAM
jgi:large subunit ribosomal protein L54